MGVLREVAGDAKRAAVVARMAPEELDELAPLSRRAPRAEAERSLQLSTAFGAHAHLTASSLAKPYPDWGIFAANLQGFALAGYLQGMSPQPPVRVLIADDHLLFAEALELTLGADKRVWLVGRATDCKIAVEPACIIMSDAARIDIG